MCGTMRIYYFFCWLAFISVMVSSERITEISSLRDISKVMNARLSTEARSVRHEELRKKFIEKVMRTNVTPNVTPKNTDGTRVDGVKNRVVLRDTTHISHLSDQ
jgi:putative lipase involved disintegration of autophagic bodies